MKCINSEADWLTWTDPEEMLTSLRGRWPSDRKLRLFACAVCRSVWDLIIHPESRSAVETAEKFADSQVSKEELRVACEQAREISMKMPNPDEDVTNYESWHACIDAWSACEEEAEKAAYDISQKNYASNICNVLRDTISFIDVTLPASLVKCHICDGQGGEMVATYGPPRETHHCGVKMQERRDTGNCRDGYWPTWCPKCWWCQLPEHTGYRIDKPCTLCKARKVVPRPCPWLTPTVLSLAKAAYEDRKANGALDELTLNALADALTEEGCTQETLLSHLRSPTPQYRGMWSLDLILRKS